MGEAENWIWAIPRAMWSRVVRTREGKRSGGGGGVVAGEMARTKGLHSLLERTRRVAK